MEEAERRAVDGVDARIPSMRGDEWPMGTTERSLIGGAESIETKGETPIRVRTAARRYDCTRRLETR